MAAAAEGRETIIVKSHDGFEFEVTVEAAKLCKTIGRGIDDDPCEGYTYTALNVTSDALKLAIVYCERHAESEDAHAAAGDHFVDAASGSNPALAMAKDALEKWDREFVDGLKQRHLFDLVLAAHYLEITDLLDLTCNKVASMMMGKTPPQIRKMFNIVSDFTKEEEDEIRKEYPGAFDD